MGGAAARAAARDRIHRRRHRRAPARPRRAAVVHGDERAPPGRASGDRAAHGPRSGARATADRRQRAARARAVGGEARRREPRVPHQRRGSGARLSADAGPPRRLRSRAPTAGPAASASTPTCAPATRCRRSTTRCWPRWWPGAGTATRRSRPWSEPSRRRGSKGWRPRIPLHLAVLGSAAFRAGALRHVQPSGLAGDAQVQSPDACRRHLTASAAAGASSPPSAIVEGDWTQPLASSRILSSVRLDRRPDLMPVPTGGPRRERPPSARETSASIDGSSSRRDPTGPTSLRCCC